MPVTDDSPFGHPLALGQERIWASEQMSASDALYGSPVVLALRGDMDLEALQESLTEIISRHSVLRSVVSTASGTARLVARAATPVRLSPVETQGTDGFEDLVSREVLAPWDLEAGPLVRLGLYRLGEADHRLLIDVHHMVFDALSFDVLVGELTELYDAKSKGREPALPALVAQYRDYALAQRRALAQGLLDDQIDYWCHELSGAPFALSLPTDRPRPARIDFSGASHTFTFDAGLRDRVIAAARGWKATPFVVMLTAWVAVLSQYCDQNEVLVGTPAAGRLDPETDDLIGMFVNTLVLRLRFERDKAFPHMVDHVRQVVFSGLAHQEAPIEKVVERLRPPRDDSRSPVFQTLFTLAEHQDRPHHAGGLVIETVPPPPRTTSRLDLSIEIVEHTNGFDAEIEYSTALFDAETISRIATHFGTFLRGALEDAERSVGEIPLLSQAEHEEALRHASGEHARLLHATLAARLSVDTPPPVDQAGDGTRVFVLDQGLRPTPVGAIGEIYLAGPFPGATPAGATGLRAESFVACPFGGPGEQMYRTGDRARRRTTGELELVGRRDQMVELNGYRVDLSEIETVLSGHPGAGPVAATIKSDGPGGGQVVAYVVSDVPDEAILAYAAERLPRYLRPTIIVHLDTLPLTADGKVDLGALPTPDRSTVRPRSTPTTGHEQQLCQIFSEILEVETVGVNDDFFDIGGHSLLAVRLLSRVRTTFGVEFGLQDLLDTATAAGLAERIATGGVTATTRPPLVPMSSRP
ncbi:condensation domain-containing protein [Catenulispora pinisilvae]|uniref:condensation domain-containing protein n=1 Tax=Catenulispora pinisilvae TaxID=2705253 RepID=UPI0018917EA5|nr:condensation domain-containing protein [Catenulispora pinisilvae]